MHENEIKDVARELGLRVVVVEQVVDALRRRGLLAGEQFTLLPEEPAPPAAAPREDDSFARFWAAYPKCQRKTDRPECLRLFTAIVAGKQKDVPKTDPERIVAAVEAYAASLPDPQFIPAPARWLRGARWEQFVPAAAPDTSQPDDLALVLAKVAAFDLQYERPRPSRDGRLMQRDMKRLADVARVGVWRRTGADPAAGNPNWWLRQWSPEEIDRAMAYAREKWPRSGTTPSAGTGAPKGTEARVRSAP